MMKEWVLSIRDQCERAKIPFFFKRWGGVLKSQAGRQLDGELHDGMPSRTLFPELDDRPRMAAIRQVEELLRTAIMEKLLVREG
jgi:hypothetical protein